MTQAEREIAMFGCAKSTLDEVAANAQAWDWGCERGVKSIALSILSDAQEFVELGEGERARQQINRAKYLLDTYLKG